MEIERRKHPRFRVRDNAFALFQLEPPKLAPIVNVSLGGLGIAAGRSHPRDEGFSAARFLEIMVDDCSFYMDNLLYERPPKFKSFYQNRIDADENICGLKFVDLTSAQKFRLKYFIRNHAVGGMTPKFIRKFNQHILQFLDQKDYGAACRNISFQRPLI